MSEWYKSDAATIVAVGIAILTTGLGIGGCNMLLNKGEAEKERAKIGYAIQERDLNGNGINEQFYEINGKKYFLKIDGKNLESTLNE